LVRAFWGRIESTVAPNVDQVDDLAMRAGNGDDNLSWLREHVCDVQTMCSEEFLTATFDVANAKTIGALQTHERGVRRQSRAEDAGL
jgi:hypothetical protein